MKAWSLIWSSDFDNEGPRLVDRLGYSTGRDIYEELIYDQIGQKFSLDLAGVHE